MNNKSLYMVESLVALVMLLFEFRDIHLLEVVVRTIICGGALYYVFNYLKKVKGPNMWLFLLLSIGVIYNPILPLKWSNIVWIVADIATMGIFYLLSLKTPIGEEVITHKDFHDN